MRNLVLALLLAVGAAPGCGFLSTATAPPPFEVELPRTISLTAPDSVLVNLVEAYRVHNVAAYMRGVVQSATPATDFQATFDGSERSYLMSQQGATATLLDGWRSQQEQNSIGAVMNSFSNSDSGRLVINKIRELPGNVFFVSYRVRGVPLSGGVCAGTANITFVVDGSGKWAMKTWDDFSTGDSAQVSYGALRFKNWTQ